MQIELSKNEFKTLLELVYLGEWVANGYRLADEHLTPYVRLEERLLRLAARAGLDALVELEERGDVYPAEAFTEPLYDLIEAYDNNTFWEELPLRLADRDLLERHGSTALEAMSEEERFTRLSSVADRYEEELERFGVERLRIVESPEGQGIHNA